MKELGLHFFDKTSNLKYIDEQGFPQFAIWRRPPRYGKTTLLKLISAFYDVNTTLEWRNYLFSGTNIGCTLPKTQYYTMLFDFTCGSHLHSTMQSPLVQSKLLGSHYMQVVVLAVGNFVHRYRHKMQLEEVNSILLGKNGFQQYEALMGLCSSKGWNLFFLIDEIDAGAKIEYIQNQPVQHDQGITIMKQIFSVCKNQAANVCRGFAVGITTLTAGNILSLGQGWEDITYDRNLETAAGLTKPEINEVLEKFSPHTKNEELMEYLERNHNGYTLITRERKVGDGSTKIIIQPEDIRNSEPIPLFNMSLTSAILASYFNDRSYSGQIEQYSEVLPIHLVSEAVRFSDVNELLKDLLTNNRLYLKGLEVSNLYRYENNMATPRDHYLKLLFTVGLLSLSPHEDRVKVRATNETCAAILNSYLLDPHPTNNGSLSSEFHAIGNNLLQGNLEEAFTSIEQSTFKSFNNRDAGDELSFKAITLTHLSVIESHSIFSEYYSAGYYLDLYIRQGAAFYTRYPHYKDLIIELKFLRFSEVSYKGKTITNADFDSALDMNQIVIKREGSKSWDEFQNETTKQVVRYYRTMKPEIERDGRLNSVVVATVISISWRKIYVKILDNEEMESKVGEASKEPKITHQSIPDGGFVAVVEGWEVVYYRRYNSRYNKLSKIQDSTYKTDSEATPVKFDDIKVVCVVEMITTGGRKNRGYKLQEGEEQKINDLVRLEHQDEEKGVGVDQKDGDKDEKEDEMEDDEEEEEAEKVQNKGKGKRERDESVEEEEEVEEEIVERANKKQKTEDHHKKKRVEFL
eukprot:TRINITY_DN2968_c0_g1_i2.p1 TRINITY_DN2968_c0_g1~~TRINITY_DN2968_c0_g1_i2.p1  ORF type:complete len:935 (+),score=113.12 TRINITY_DN2968_c0_g1_i2:401-2806(+)